MKDVAKSICRSSYRHIAINPAVANEGGVSDGLGISHNAFIIAG